MKEIKIKYFTDQIEKLRYIDGKSDWIDLRAAEEVHLKAGEFRLISLGVSMRLSAASKNSSVSNEPALLLSASFFFL